MRAGHTHFESVDEAQQQRFVHYLGSDAASSMFDIGTFSK